MIPGLLLRTALALLVASLPPAVGMLLVGLPGGNRPTGADLAVRYGAVLLLSIAWIALVAVVYSRVIRQEVDGILDPAERGEPSVGEADLARRRLSATLDERDRQVAELARQAGVVPIGDEPTMVAQHVVSAVHTVTGDPTWVLAVLDSELPDRLPPGVYDAGGQESAPLDDLHRWASVAAADDGVSRTSLVDGPWGAFVVISLASNDQLRAVLVAPWEGRVDPSAAEKSLLSLVGQHAATALEHAILYARVQAQAEELDRMAAVQRDFLRSVSHDLQTPLTSIRAAAAEIRAQVDLDEQADHDLDLVEHQADRLRRMVAQLLVNSRLEAGALQPQAEIVNPRPLVDRTWAALRAVNCRLVVETSGPSHLVVADLDRLEQVLWAVFDNAVKYSPAGGVVRVHIGVSGDRAVIEIRDEGMGMDRNTLGRVFEQFYRAAEARRVVPDGSGIGLHAAKGLMEAMGGSIDIASQLGMGTAVRLELPAELIEEGVVPVHHEAT